MQDWQQKMKQLQQWWQTPAGNILLDIEMAFLRAQLQEMFGFQAVIIGGEEYGALTNVIRTSRCVRIDPMQQDLSHLPPKIDVIILPHMLSFIDELSPLLEALQAKLETHGKVLVTGYRNQSVLGLQRLLRCKVVKGMPYARHNLSDLQQHFLGSDFQVTWQTYFAAVWVRARLTLLNHQLNAAMLGNVFALTLTKKLATVKTFKPEWQANNVTQPSSVLNSIGESNE